MGIHAIKTSASWWLDAALSVTLAVFGVSASLADPLHNAEKANVHVQARGTPLRGSCGLNQDVYLVELFPKNAETGYLGPIVDEYEKFAPPRSRHVLNTGDGTVVRTKRDETCDVAYAGMHLRAAPGNLMALLHERLAFRPTLLKTPDSLESLPCYRAVRPI